MIITLCTIRISACTYVLGFFYIIAFASCRILFEKHYVWEPVEFADKFGH